MARYPEEHKERTRERLVAEAARVFRRKGYDKAGIDEIMAAAGLTRGGFYRHFGSKAALFAEAMGGEHEFVERLRARTGEDASTLADEGEAIALAYLAPENRAGVLGGCSLSALAMDTSRRNAAARRAYTAAVESLTAEFARGLGDDDAAIAAIVTCVGGLLVSSAVSDPELADRISRVAQDRVRALTDEAKG